jgi:enediyne biosynthesis protein E4
MRVFFSCVFIVLAGVVGILPCAAQLQWHQVNGFKWAELQVPRDGKPGFALLPPEQTGITFTNPLDERVIAANRVLANGSGLAIGDFGNNGLPGIFFCSLDAHNALYKNLGGMRFKDVTQESGIVCSNQICRGAVFADINGDGWLDLLISTTGSGVLCFTNRGDGTFAECSKYAGTLSKYGATTMALADIDGNGALDLYVADYRVEDARDRAEFDKFDIFRVNGQLAVAPTLQDRFVFTDGSVQEFGEPDLVYLNDGKGRFTPLSWTNGAFLDEDGKPLTDPPRDWSLTAAFHDLNGDGAPDIYVCSDYWTPDRLWINDGQGHFRACPRLALRHTSKSSMGVDFADIDRDGQVDFCVTDMLARDWQRRKRQIMVSGLPRSPIGTTDDRPQIPRNVLFRNRGDGTFEEIAAYAGVTASDWTWQPVFIDVDLDGYEDIITPTGYAHDVNDLDALEKADMLRRAGRLAPPKTGLDGKPLPRSLQEQKNEELYHGNMLAAPLKTPIVAFRNLGNMKFEDIGPAWGLDQPGLPTAIALGDLDNDGGLDFVVNNLGSVAGIYHNHGSAPRVAVRLKGLPPNTQGIGGKIKLLGGSVPMQSQEVACGGIYLSGSDPLRVFAAGKSENMTLEVTWRSSRKSVVRDVKPNRIYEIDEAGAVPGETKQPIQAVKPFFKDVSDLIAHRHHQEFYDDYARQPLLPFQLSQAGPGVAWVNLLGDRREELVIGSGRGGELAIYAPDGKGGMTRTRTTSNLPEDLAGIVGWVRGANERTLVVGRDNYESQGKPPSTSVVSFSGTPGSQDLPETRTSTGPLAVADIYGDGNLDLFVGGRVIPGRYPEAADSRIYRNVGGQLQLDVENSRLLEKVGLVSGAVWSDLDGDGFPELILACEWGPVRVFKNRTGHLREITKELGLDRYTGWWRGVTTGDIDGDGRLDIIASNWGLNSDYQADSNQPARLYYGDFSDRGALDLIEAVYDPLRQVLVPRRMRDALANAYPPLVGRFPTHKAYCEATLEQILAFLPKPAGQVQATTLASMVFLNRSNRFEAVELPYEAQIAPAFAVNVGDFDGDGNEDIFLGQNFFAMATSMAANMFQVVDGGRRLDAGRGLWLRGTGGGRLEAVSGQQSGILVYGEQRGAALCDFDGDGRVDLAVSQNGAQTKLYQNVQGKPGLRVRLNGPPGNPDGVGATMRLVVGGRMGAAREIHGGSGYWSQDSAVQVLGCPESPTQIWVRWPGGKITTSPIPPGAKEIVVDTDGKVTMNR